MRKTRSNPLTAQAILLAWIEILEIMALVQSLIVLTNALWNWGFLLFDTSSLSRALSLPVPGNATTPAIYDWYEAHYHSICYGMWNNHVFESGRNMSVGSPRSCATQALGYTFSLARVLFDTATSTSTTATTTARPVLDILASYGTVDTKASVALLIVGIIFTGISQVLYLDSILALVATNMREEHLLMMLRVAFLSSIPAVITLTISAAKITARAKQIQSQAAGIGIVGVGSGVTATVKAHLGSGFFPAMWIATGFMWLALAIEVVVALRIARGMRRQCCNGGGSEREPGVHEKKDVCDEVKMEM
ncbi:hypothetical protein LTR10_016243 [Elasticomyces elasticus]|uniref:Uncharacterized protein n=1 Tax=Exophiala sideris TaxID=1016849 RepID=A0ABR0JNB9_9EURO|nr:hypothetical protein LTR10_016243 [Elasticomyces elasticus]KAK5037925.1 hypothetical protein LTS07_001392 [Exophiala sideris]KAK5043908.1 hypothetical protein LTR13_000262 [Exophiala sideris]KAK5067407.1 hypothetical protein LTR69_001394 [Exophiala sideris]KAK5182740.1 hypothetical protein LTR44_005131 [Eurotiomycetes sp. CCFEE 6388]